VEVTSSGPALGEIVCRGRLLDLEGRRLAGYRQTLQLWRGSQVLLLDVELEIDEEPRADPWNSYYAARFAWADEAADLLRSVGGGSEPTDAKRLEAPLFVEARTETTRTAILTGGLPYHRRIGFRMLDTLLVVRGESRRRFRLGLGFDLPYALPAALELISPLPIAEGTAPPRPAASSWLFHVDARNLVATHWEPLVETSAEPRVAGFRVRLLEIEGRGGRARLRAFRPIASARQTDFQHQTLATLPTQDDAIQIDFAAHEWVQVEARWD
jgi:alpha-mannosidase